LTEGTQGLLYILSGSWESGGERRIWELLLGASCLFCVFDETGVGPTDEEPPVVDDDEVPIAEAVVIQPAFTG
jgi:hypothetical protein